MTPDRLSELCRQRAQIADHLAWLDREIAAAGSTPDTLAAPTAPTKHPDVRPNASAADSQASAESILQHYRNAAADAPADARAGCLRFFLIGTSLVVLTLFAIYWFGYRGPAKAAPPVPATPPVIQPARPAKP